MNFSGCLRGAVFKSVVFSHSSGFEGNFAQQITLTTSGLYSLYRALSSHFFARRWPSFFFLMGMNHCLENVLKLLCCATCFLVLQIPTMLEMIDMWKKNHNAFGLAYGWFLAKACFLGLHRLS